MTDKRPEALRRWEALPEERRDPKIVALLALQLLKMPSEHLCQALVIGGGSNILVVIAGACGAGHAIKVRPGEGPEPLAARVQAAADARVARDEAISRVVEGVPVEVAGRLHMPITEDEIARSVAALERAERISIYQARVREDWLRGRDVL